MQAAFPFQGTFGRIAGVLKSAFFPNRCVGCDALFFFAEGFPSPSLWPEQAGSAAGPAGESNPLQGYQRLMSPFLCPACITGVVPVTPPVCPGCGLMFQSRKGENHLCGDCLAAPRYFHSARAAGIYDQTLKAAIHHLKYKGKIGLARPLGRFLYMTFLRYFDAGSVDLVVPVPLHMKKLRQRGFNQALLLMREWEKLSSGQSGTEGVFRINGHSLVRERQTQPQTRLTRKERQSNIKNAFSVCDAPAVAEKNILLVDDVFTTGATVDECAKVLLNAGAKKVHVLTLARAW